MVYSFRITYGGISATVLGQRAHFAFHLIPCHNTSVHLRQLICLSIALCFSLALASPQVRVLLDELETGFVMQMPSAHRGYVDGAPRFSTPFGLAWPITAYGSQIYIDNTPVGRSFALEPTDGQFISWNGVQYRGALRFLAVDNKLAVINVLDIEAYLRGVVPAEMAASWPLEALKAQAVAARTFTLSQLDADHYYDVCATTNCQKYEGVGAEHPGSDRAILETAGLVVTYNGDYAQTYYHSDSGGMIASSAEVWGGQIPYLTVKRDPVGDTPHDYWEVKLSPASIAASLASIGVSVGTVQAVRALSYSESGRVTRAEISGSSGQTVLSGKALRELSRNWGLKSTRFSMLGNLSAAGRGWGHGVGMSQYGAMTLAESGYNHLQILAFYYPNTALQQHVYVTR